MTNFEQFLCGVGRFSSSFAPLKPEAKVQRDLLQSVILTIGLRIGVLNLSLLVRKGIFHTTSIKNICLLGESMDSVKW